MGSVLAISWALVLQKAFDHGHQGLGKLAITVAYPLSDVLTIAAVAMTMPLTPRRYRTPFCSSPVACWPWQWATACTPTSRCKGTSASGGAIDAVYVAGYLLASGVVDCRPRARPATAVDGTTDEPTVRCFGTRC